MIRQLSSEHSGIDELLPWYVNQTLDDRERARVERHLEACTTCQENVVLWSQVESAVRTDSPVPFVPEPNTDALLKMVEENGRRRPAGNARKTFLIAASLLVVIAVTIMVSNRILPGTPVEFETVISESADNTVQYIVELRFDGNASTTTRKEILESLGSVASDMPVDSDVITLHIGAGSLPKLQARMDDVRALPNVVDAKIVAVHLPVD